LRCRADTHLTEAGLQPTLQNLAAIITGDGEGAEQIPARHVSFQLVSLLSLSREAEEQGGRADVDERLFTHTRCFNQDVVENWHSAIIA